MIFSSNPPKDTLFEFEFVTWIRVVLPRLNVILIESMYIRLNFANAYIVDIIFLPTNKNQNTESPNQT